MTQRSVRNFKASQRVPQIPNIHKEDLSLLKMGQKTYVAIVPLIDSNYQQLIAGTVGSTAIPGRQSPVQIAEAVSLIEG